MASAVDLQPRDPRVDAGRRVREGPAELVVHDDDGASVVIVVAAVGAEPVRDPVVISSPSSPRRRVIGSRPGSTRIVPSRRRRGDDRHQPFGRTSAGQNRCLRLDAVAIVVAAVATTLEGRCSNRCPDARVEVVSSSPLLRVGYGRDLTTSGDELSPSGEAGDRAAARDRGPLDGLRTGRASRAGGRRPARATRSRPSATSASSTAPMRPANIV